MIPNLSYISEAAACLLDRQLKTFLVPYTDVVKLSSKSFHYDYWDRRAYYKKHKPLPSKVGSFQVFLKGFQGLSLYALAHSGFRADILRQMRMFFCENTHGRTSLIHRLEPTLLLEGERLGRLHVDLVVLSMMILMRSLTRHYQLTIQIIAGLYGLSSCSKTSARSLRSS